MSKGARILGLLVTLMISLSKSASAELSDTLVFDLNQAVYSTNAGVSYIDIPVLLHSSNTSVNAIDFWFQFDLTKLSYVSTSTTLSGFDVFSNYNSSNQNLSNTSSGTSTNFNLPTYTTIMTLRFQLLNSCLIIGSSEFYNPTTLVNGIVSSYQFTDATAPDPVLITTPAPFCSGSSVNFYYGTTIYGRPILEYSWDFGNGQQSTLQDPTTSYNSYGDYVVVLNVVAENGCQYPIPSQLIVVNQTPQVSFSYSYDTLQNSVAFTNSSFIDFGQIVSYSWDFGDFTTSSQIAPTHTYPNHAVYTVSLTATSDSGCVSSAQQVISTELGVEELGKRTVSIYPNPTAEYLTLISPERMKACVVNSVGQQVSEVFVLLPNQSLIYDVSNFAVGNYYLVFENRPSSENIIFQVKR